MTLYPEVSIREAFKKYSSGATIMPVYNSAGTCPACGEDTVVMGDQRIVCGTGRERIARHNALRDALHDTAAAAGQKETRALLPGNNRRPADVYIPGWSGGRDAAVDVCVTQPPAGQI